MVPLLMTLLWLASVLFCAFVRVGEWKRGRWTFFVGPVAGNLVFSFKFTNQPRT